MCNSNAGVRGQAWPEAQTNALAGDPRPARPGVTAGSCCGAGCHPATQGSHPGRGTPFVPNVLILKMRKPGHKEVTRGLRSQKHLSRERL